MWRSRLLTLLYFIIAINAGIVNAQDKERLKELLKLEAKSDTFQLQTHSKEGNVVGASFISGQNGGYVYDNSISPQLNFKPSQAWKFDVNAIQGLNNYQNIFWYNNSMLYGLPGNVDYFGLYGTAIHKVNDKLYLGTMTLIDRTPETMQMIYYNGGNINSSVFVGYKFSDKFSISAGFNIRRYDNPWKMGPSLLNGGYIP